MARDFCLARAGVLISMSDSDSQDTSAHIYHSPRVTRFQNISIKMLGDECSQKYMTCIVVSVSVLPFLICTARAKR